MSAVVVVIPVLARAGGMAEMLRPLAGPSSFQRTVQSALTDLPGSPIVVTTDDPEAAAAAAA
ncbi:MAG: transferase, partial [Pseudomonadota bacterium]|nr:transferase [Pseudomonadota bacterium]